jgi:hypothetical protein
MPKPHGKIEACRLPHGFDDGTDRDQPARVLVSLDSPRMSWRVGWAPGLSEVVSRVAAAITRFSWRCEISCE